MLCGLDYSALIGAGLAALSGGFLLAYSIARGKLSAYRGAVDLLDDALKNDGRVDTVEAALLIEAAKKML